MRAVDKEQKVGMQVVRRQAVHSTRSLTVPRKRTDGQIYFESEQAKDVRAAVQSLNQKRLTHVREVDAHLLTLAERPHDAPVPHTLNPISGLSAKPQNTERWNLYADGDNEDEAVCDGGPSDGFVTRLPDKSVVSIPTDF